MCCKIVLFRENMPDDILSKINVCENFRPLHTFIVHITKFKSFALIIFNFVLKTVILP